MYVFFNCRNKFASVKSSSDRWVTNHSCKLPLMILNYLFSEFFSWSVKVVFDNFKLLAVEELSYIPCDNFDLNFKSEFVGYGLKLIFLVILFYRNMDLQILSQICILHDAESERQLGFIVQVLRASFWRTFFHKKIQFYNLPDRAVVNSQYLAN